jgi:hypothetical protein
MESEVFSGPRIDLPLVLTPLEPNKLKITSFGVFGSKFSPACNEILWFS